MKKIFLFISFALVLCANGIVASNAVTTVAKSEKTDTYSEIKFDTLRINLGSFPESSPEQKCSFGFINTGTAPLIINQAFASCGCTVPTYTKTPIKPGDRGTIDVTYNGKGKFPGHFQKTITVRTNAKNEIVRLTIEGTMTEK